MGARAFNDPVVDCCERDAADCDCFPMELARWSQLDLSAHNGRPCPMCGDSMIYPTSCRCDYETRVWALAGLDGPAEWSRANVIKVNAAMRALDESHLWPIRSRFNVTNRAIDRCRRVDQESLDGYVRGVDWEIGRIVNDPRTL